MVDASTAECDGARAGRAGRCLIPCCPTTTANLPRCASSPPNSPRRIPKIAGRLRLSGDAVDDPHVARLLEGVAFLGARVQQRLDDEFPELTDALLDVLYPHYLAPVPSCTIAQFHCAPDLDIPVPVPAGIALDTEPVRGEVCRFRTAWAQTLWPIEIENVQLTGLPLIAPPNPRAAGAVAVLRIRLRCTGNTTFTALGLDRLRVFLRAPPNVSLPLLELLSAHAVSVGLCRWPDRCGGRLSCPAAPSRRSASRRMRRCCPGRRAASRAFGC